MYGFMAGPFVPFLAPLLVLDTNLPEWAREALKIANAEDVEQLEKNIMSAAPPDDFVHKVFSLNKAKLLRCLQEISAIQQATPTQPNLLMPGASMSFVFRIRAPY